MSRVEPCIRNALALGLIAGVAGAGSTALADIDVGGERVEVVDMHLHIGSWSNQPLTAKEFIGAAQPAPFRLYAPALVNALTDPYLQHIGVLAQTEWGGVDRAVLYATYTQDTVGYMTNSSLLEVLTDPRNEGWAWGFGSINLDDISDPSVRAARVAALSSYFAEYPELFIGIKLAHAHQAIAFDDVVMNDIYDVAAEYGVPVLLHTGFSPFPKSQTEREFYDPSFLRAAVEAYDGQAGRPRVDFVLSHIGQGDPRATRAALDLAADHDNVWLELSALSGALRLDENGDPSTSTEPQYPAVLEAILERGLVDKTLFATDGPQFSGKVRSYTKDIADEMLSLGYSIEQIRAVMAGNFHRLYGTD